MNLILLDQQELDNDTVTLTDRRCTHIRKVLRNQVGDKVRVGLINGPIGRGCILALEPRQAVLTLTFDNQPPPPPLTDLILALPRPIMLKRVLSQAVQIGVGRIFLINANRVEKSFFSASLLQDDNLQNFLRLGLEQAMDTRLPEVSLHPRFLPFVEDVLPGLTYPGTTRLVAHPTATSTLPKACPPQLMERALIAIGPEGGWVDFEIDQFQEQGFRAFSLGPRILRVDTAVPALLAQIELLRSAELR
jgi:RsmE family RNA methyltransferase